MASLAPWAASVLAMPHAIERSDATPRTRPFLPAMSAVASVILASSGFPWAGFAWDLRPAPSGILHKSPRGAKPPHSPPVGYFAGSRLLTTRAAVRQLRAAEGGRVLRYGNGALLSPFT